jgi:hypothetical protein
LDAVLAQAKDWRFLKSDGRFGEPIEFLHQLFQEYFAALSLNCDIERERARKGAKGRERSVEAESTIRHLPYARSLGNRPFKDEWHETIVMLAGICDQPAELVKWLGAQVVEKQQGHAAFLVQRCWETSDAAANDEARAAVVDALIAALRDTEGMVRGRAADALGEIGAPASRSSPRCATPTHMCAGARQRAEIGDARRAAHRRAARPQGRRARARGRRAGGNQRCARR